MSTDVSRSAEQVAAGEHAVQDAADECAEELLLGQLGVRHEHEHVVFDRGN